MGFRPETFNNFPSCSRPCVDATNLFIPTATGLLYVRKWNHVARDRASTATPVRGPALLTEGAFRSHPVQFGCAGLISGHHCGRRNAACLRSYIMKFSRKIKEPNTHSTHSHYYTATHLISQHTFTVFEEVSVTALIKYGEMRPFGTVAQLLTLWSNGLTTCFNLVSTTKWMLDIFWKEEKCIIFCLVPEFNPLPI